MPLFDPKELKQDLEMIEKNTKTLEKQYTDFFEGVLASEPKALRIQTEALVRKWWGRPMANAGSRFQVQNMVQRYNSFKEKWDRRLRIKARAEREEAFE